MTATTDQTQLELPLEETREEHDWELHGSPGMFEQGYRCIRCGALWMESIDNPHSKKPKYGCRP